MAVFIVQFIDGSLERIEAKNYQVITFDAFENNIQKLNRVAIFFCKALKNFNGKLSFVSYIPLESSVKAARSASPELYCLFEIIFAALYVSLSY